MGCGIARGKRGKVMHFDLQVSGNPRYDSLFQDLEEPLSTLSDAREMLNQAHVAFQKEVGTLKQLRNPTFFDSLMAMLFCFSASGEGYLENIDFSLTPSPPFLTVNENLLYREHRGILPAWNRLVTLADGIPRAMSSLDRRLEAAIEESASNRDLDFTGGEPEMKISPALRTISSNHSKLVQAPSVLEGLVNQSQEITDTIANLPMILSRAQIAIVAVGKQAYIDQNIEPRDIVEKYWPNTESRVAA